MIQEITIFAFYGSDLNIRKMTSNAMTDKINRKLLSPGF